MKLKGREKEGFAPEVAAGRGGHPAELKQIKDMTDNNIPRQRPKIRESKSKRG